MRAALLLAKGKTAAERERFLSNFESYAGQGKWMPAITVEQFPLLFYPGDAVRQSMLAVVIAEAQKQGALANPGPSEPQALSPLQWAAWEGIPPLPPESPLVHWLPTWLPREAVDTQVSRGMNAQGIDWQFWKAMRTVKLWQACALAVGLDPDKLREHPQAWMAGIGAGASIIVDDRCFPNTRLRDKFGKVLRLACSAVSHMEGPIYPQGMPIPNHDSRKDVLLPEVVRFLAGAGVHDLPIELAASQSAEKLDVEGVDLSPLTYVLTVGEAQELLRAKTGQDWPLGRLIGAGAKMAVWLEPSREHPEFFAAYPAGFAAPIIEGGDLQRLAFTRDSGTLTVIQDPSGTCHIPSLPATFDVSAVRVSLESLEALAGRHEPPQQVTPSEAGANWDAWKLLDEIAALLSKAERPDGPYPQVLSIQRRWHDNIAAAVAAGELNIFDAGFIQGRKVRADEMPRALNWCRVSVAALDKWLADMGSIYRLQAPPEQPEQEVQAATHGAVEPEPMQRSRAQESAILDAIRGAGQEPKSLPKNPSGRPGVKAEIRTQVTKEYPGLFPANSTVFDKAWDRLRSFGDIADREG